MTAGILQVSTSFYREERQQWTQVRQKKRKRNYANRIPEYGLKILKR